MQALPIDPVIPALQAALRDHGTAVLTAPPGAGKSTRIPPAVLGEGLLHPDHPRVLLLQPRRVAAVGLARRIAAEQHWRMGSEIGYRIRFDTVGGAATRLWVQTEGTLTRQLMRDPYLEGVGAVILDEFHERSIHSDLALAWLKELRQTLREDLKVIVMSATMQTEMVRDFLGDAPLVEAPAAPFVVRTSHHPAKDRERLAEQVVRILDEALSRDDHGDVLVFLPGMGEIRACQSLLNGREGLSVCPLHGSLPPEEQDRALAPAPAKITKVVLATNVAETSITIPGVRTVIDSGQARVARFNPATGFDELHLEAISRFSATQREGRAGRTADGRCYRLWSKLEDRRRREALASEVARVDLAPLLVQVKYLQGEDTRAFPFFEAPPEALWTQTEELLAELGVSSKPFAGLSAKGRYLADLPLHPRLACLLACAHRAGVTRLGADVAAILSERDLRPLWRKGDPPATPQEADLIDRLDALKRARSTRFARSLRHERIDGGAARQVDQAARQFRSYAKRLFGAESQVEIPRLEEVLPQLILSAYPDRIARRSTGNPNRLDMLGGAKVAIEPGSALYVSGKQPYRELVVAHGVQGFGGRTRRGPVLQMGAEITEADLEALYPDAVVREEQLRYVSEKGRVVAAAVWRYQDLVIRYREGIEADAAAVSTCLVAGMQQEGWGDPERLLADHRSARSLWQRWCWLHATVPDSGLPDPAQTDWRDILESLARDRRSRQAVLSADPLPWLQGILGFDAQRRIDAWAPERLQVPSGNRIALDYSDERPVLAVRIQELFGLTVTPTLADGRIPVVLHLLAPNFRPAQITNDLASFWANTYPQVRKDLRGRYPKHDWPDDPLTATPSAKGGRRR